MAEKVGGGKLKKQTELQKAATTFFENDFKNLMIGGMTYGWNNVVIPGFKRMIRDFVDAMLYPGGSAPRDKGGNDRPSYRRFYDDGSDLRRSQSIQPKTQGYYYDPVIFSERGKAELVLIRLLDTLDEYGRVSVADLYDISEIDPELIPHTANRYGWMDLRSAKVVSDGEGYIIKLPRALAIT